MPSISTLSELSARSSAPIIQQPLSDSSFKLDSSGIAGFFGGDSAWKALATTYILHPATPPIILLGAYNSPGAYEVLKRCAPIANSTFWDSIFPAEGRDPARILGLEVKSGPIFLEASGETVRTGHPSYLIERQAHRHRSTKPPPSNDHTFHITIIDLPSEPLEGLIPPLKLSTKAAAASSVGPAGIFPESFRRALRPRPPNPRVQGHQLILDSSAVMWIMLIWAIPAYGSVATCIVCALARDWWCFVSILTGIYAGAFIRSALGMGRFTVTSPDCVPCPQNETGGEEQRGPPSIPHQKCNHTHASEGLLLHDSGIIVLRGNKNTLVHLTRGRFHIAFAASEDSIQINFGLSALVIQFLTQLVLIPQGTLFGQLMFVASLAVSSMYNIYLAMRQDTFQKQYLLNLCGLDESSFKQTTMRSKAGMAVYACLALRHQSPFYAPTKLLDALVTEKGAVWERWKELVARQLQNEEHMEFSQEVEIAEGLDEAEKALLVELLKDAEDAYRTPGWRSVDPEGSDRSVADKDGEKEEQSRVVPVVP